MSPETASMTAELPAFDPIALDEVLAVADLQTRRDRKYLVEHELVWHLLEGLDARALEIDGLRTFRYESIYFDTSSRDSYLRAAHRRPHRFKVRTRTYRDSGECLLEVKVRDHRGRTVKHRRPHDPDRRRQLGVDGAAFVSSIDAASPFVDELQPVLEVRYRRSTLVLACTMDRVTIDRYLSWSATGRPVELHGLAVIETKSSGPPTELDRRLWSAGHRPRSISKYCTGLAAIEPALPSNKWHRVLERHVLPNLGTPG